MQVHLLVTGEKPVKCAASYLLRSVARHSDDCSSAVASAGAVGPLVTYLGEADPGLQEAGAWTLGYLAQQSLQVAHQVCEGRGVVWGRGRGRGRAGGVQVPAAKRLWEVSCLKSTKVGKRGWEEGDKVLRACAIWGLGAGPPLKPHMAPGN